MRGVLQIVLLLSGTALPVLGRPMPVARAAADVSVEIAKKATLVDDGQAVDVEVEVACAEGRTVLEAFVYVVQDGQQT